MGIFKRVSILATHELSRIFKKNSTFKEKMPKQKLYQITTPFDDPKMEKRRQDAIKAKEARDKDKVKLLALKRTIEKLERKTEKLERKTKIQSIILKSHNIIIDDIDEESDSDMEIISGNETVSARYAFMYHKWAF